MPARAAAQRRRSARRAVRTSSRASGAGMAGIEDRHGDQADRLIHGLLDRPPAQPSLGAEDHPVIEDRGIEPLHVVGEDEVAAGEGGEGRLAR